MGDYQPARDGRIERFIDTLPAGIKQETEHMRSQENGLLYPAVAVRYWQELASQTDDGRDIMSSGPSWLCIATTTSRQYAGMLTESLRKLHPKLHFEVWALFPFNSAAGPHIIDYAPNMYHGGYGEGGFRGKPSDWRTVTEEEIREFARAYVIDYYNLHPSNHRYIELGHCGHHRDHHANWECRVTFSRKGDAVTLLLSPDSDGMRVWAHQYDDQHIPMAIDEVTA